MKIRRTLGTIVLALALAGSITSCKGKNQNNSKPLTSQEYVQRAESYSDPSRVSMYYDQAQYLQIKEIIKNNASLLDKSGRTIDISTHLKNAEEYAQSAESSHQTDRISMYYDKAQYHLNQAILEQQRALKRK